MKKTWFWLVLILLIGTVLRLYNFASISLWHDEAFSALLIKYPWHEMFYRIGLDVHPPIYYIALRLWSYLFGDGLEALRGFSVFFGVGTVYAVYLFVKTAFKNTHLALAAAFLIAINPFQIQYVTEARMYTFGAFFLVMSAYFAVRALEAQKKYFEYKEQFKETAGAVANAVWLHWFLFAVCTSVILYTHYYLFFSALAIGLFVIYYLFKNYRLQLSRYRYAIAAYLIVFISYIPWLKTFVFQFSQVQENYWIPKIFLWSVPITNWRMLAGVGADANKLTTQVLLIAAMLFSLFVLYKLIRRKDLEYKNMVLFGLAIPFFGALALSIKQSIYLDRYFLFAAIFYTIALCMFIFNLHNHKTRIILFCIITLLSLSNFVKSWQDTNIKNNPGMSAAAKFLNANVASDDLLLVGSSFEFFNFKYYNKTPQRALFYAPGIKQVSDLPHFSGTAILTDEDLLHNLNAVRKGQIVWILWTNAFGGTKPEVPASIEEVTEYGWNDVRPYPGTTIFVTEYIRK